MLPFYVTPVKDSVASAVVSGRKNQDKKTGLSLRPSSRNAQNLSPRITSKKEKTIIIHHQPEYQKQIAIAFD